MSYVLTLFGLMLILYKESDVFSSDWKMILLGIGAALVALASALTCDNIYKNETRIGKLEEEIKKLKGEDKNNERDM